MKLLEALAKQVYIKCETIEERDRCEVILGKCHKINICKPDMTICLYEPGEYSPYGTYSFMPKFDDYPIITAQQFITSNT